MAEPLKAAAGAASNAFGKVAGFVGRSISPFHNLGSTVGQLTWIGIIGTTVGLAVGGVAVLPAIKVAFGSAAGAIGGGIAVPGLSL